MTAKPVRTLKRLADLVRPALEPALAKRGLTQASLILDWPVIAGERLAAICEPARLQWPSRGPKADPSRPAASTLWLRVSAGRSLDVQYQAPVIMDRVNAHFGWRCVAKIAVAPEPKRAPAASVRERAFSPDAQARAAAITARVLDADLREALTRLGAGVLSREA